MVDIFDEANLYNLEAAKMATYEPLWTLPVQCISNQGCIEYMD